jgi:hypothetical protein
LSIKPVSVHYSTVNATEFKIVLPYLFSSPVSGYGLDDVFVSIPSGGVNYILSGKSAFTSNNLNIQDLPLMTPAVNYDFSGRSVSNAGDVNGDGYDDLIIGVPYAARCYLMFGTEHGFMNMTEGFTIFGAQSSDLTGWSVSGAGDINNDTFADIIIGAPNAVNLLGVTSGAAYVVYGGPTDVLFDLNLDNFISTKGFVIYGASAHDACGVSVSGAGDVNGDGIDDVIVGALKMNNLFSGTAYVIYGQVDNRAAVTVSAMSQSTGFTLSGPSYSWFGYSVSGAGDVNGDHLSDIVVGSLPRRATVGTPVSYILFGTKASQSTVIATSLTSSEGLVITGGGVIVTRGSDLNGDGFVVFGAVYNLDSGGGFVVSLPRHIPKITHNPSVKPSALPSICPTKSPSTVPILHPSAAPSTATPTRPTAVPTISPSAPSSQPTASPSQPTSVPSARPTAPSFVPTYSPSVEPTHSPSEEPTENPIYAPSTRPTCDPSMRVTRLPTSAAPTHRPSVMTTREPTRYPVIRPSMGPTVNTQAPSVANITYITITLSVGGTFQRNESHTNYVVNTTSEVSILGDGGSAVFTVVPNANSSLRIGRFRVTTDIISLTHFRNILQFGDLQFQSSAAVGRNLRRNLVADGNSSLDLGLGRGQHIHIANLTEADLRSQNFIFAQPQEIPAIGNMKETWGPLIAAITVSGCFVLFLIYKFGDLGREYYKTHMLKLIPTDWETASHSNPTYLSFQDSFNSASLKSDSSLSSPQSSYRSGGSEESESETNSEDHGGDERSEEEKTEDRDELPLERLIGLSGDFDRDDMFVSGSSNRIGDHFPRRSRTGSDRSVNSSGSDLSLPRSVQSEPNDLEWQAETRIRFKHDIQHVKSEGAGTKQMNTTSGVEKEVNKEVDEEVESDDDFSSFSISDYTVSNDGAEEEYENIKI